MIFTKSHKIRKDKIKIYEQFTMDNNEFKYKNKNHMKSLLIFNQNTELIYSVKHTSNSIVEDNELIKSLLEKMMSIICNKLKIIKHSRDTNIKLTLNVNSETENLYYNNKSDIINFKVFELYIELENQEDDNYSTIWFLNSYNSLYEIYIKCINIIDSLIQTYTYKLNDMIKFTGITDVVLHPHFSSVLVHELFGHCLEEDVYQYLDIFDKEKEYFKHLFITNGNIVNGHLVTKYDDFGNKIKNQDLISNGKLINYLRNSNTNNLEYENDNILINRQRFINILPQNNNIKSMINQIERGVYLLTPTYGQVNSNGNIIIGFNNAFLIQNGKITKSILPGYTKTSAKYILENIIGIGSEYVVDSGICKKKGYEKISISGGTSLITKLKFYGK